MPTVLAASQKRYLRTLAHPLKPVLQVGAKGVSPSLLSELDGALEHHELIKVRVVAADRETRDVWIDALLEGSDATLVQRVGHIPNDGRHAGPLCQLGSGGFQLRGPAGIDNQLPAAGGQRPRQGQA